MHNLAVFLPHFAKKTARNAAGKVGGMAQLEASAYADQRFFEETVASLRRIAARLPAVLDEEVLRVAQEIEDNVTRLKQAG